ncbi:MAG: patatin-like phospholipase family protein [Porphyromonadaceae bacterium]|nr:patatin-like phospholipase family protein [Porphyromonadaceae bacterium]
MRNSAILVSLFLMLLQPLSAQRVGLVLSGGGAKGAAHIGVIKALEENNIPIDYIAGTSIGSIIGSLYAMGYTPDEMLELLLSKEFGYWQTGVVEDDYSYYFKKPDVTPDFSHFTIDISDSLQVKTSFFPQSLVNPIQMNQAFVTLFAQATAKAIWNFDNLFVPFRCIGSDIYNKRAVVFRNGDLGDAVRASMSFPFVFKPIWKDSVPLFDGGIYDNFPVTTMKSDFNPDFILGSVVASVNNKPSENPYNQMETMVMQKTEYDVPDEDGMILKFQFTDVSLLDFQKAKELMDIGYRRTLSIIDSIKMRVPREVTKEELSQKRKQYKEGLPPLIFKNIYISGVTDAQRKYIEAQLHRDINNEFSMEEFRRAYFKMLSYSKIKEIIPHAVYNRKEKYFDLYLDVTVKDEIKVSFGGNVSSHQANQLFLGINYQSLAHVAADYTANFHVGNSFSGVLFNARSYLKTRIPSYLNIQGAYSFKKYSESQSLFYEDVLPSFIQQKESYLKVKLGLPFLNRAKAEVGVSYGHLNDFYFQTSNILFANSKFDNSSYDLFSASLRIEGNSLDDKLYPVSGKQQYLMAQYINGKEKYKPATTTAYTATNDGNHSWLQIKGRLHNYHQFSNKFNLGYTAEMVISSKNLYNNYTASILQAPAFTPTPHSTIVFNEAFRANQYAAIGLSPIFKLSKFVHFRTDFYCFAPMYEIKKEIISTGSSYVDVPYYGKFMRSYNFMGETSLVIRLPFASISLYANGYSYPKQNFNFGLNIGYLLFNPKMLD